MAALRRCSRPIAWLNPMLGWRGYEPVARGMAAALPHRVREVIAVLGHDHARVGAALAELPVRIVVNDEYALGHMSSVRAGIAAIPNDPAAILVARSPTSLPSSRRMSTSWSTPSSPRRSRRSWCPCIAGSAATLSCCPACTFFGAAGG
jgi:hypothetical protein